ncbi:TPA: hypothetical protein EYP44_01220 [Candidatus Bathyarchaeota archaeon]|nr:hypothetical protein [Candidatus Bathyarchaeota archaeon]
MSKGSEPASYRFKSGLTWRALLAMVTAALLFVPTTLYMNLMAGATMAVAAIFIIAVVFGGLSRFFGAPLTKQELCIIYTVVGGIAGTIPVYYWLVFRAFFVTTPVTYAFTIDGVPLPELVPPWLAPPRDSIVYSLRTLVHPDWMMAIGIYTVWVLLGFMMEVSLAMLFSYLFIEVEELRFPMAVIDSSMVTTLAEREPESIRFFITALYPGVVYGFLLCSGLAGVPLIPLPWADFTWLSEKVLPGALIGIATDVVSFVLGLILPKSATASMLIGSLSIWVVGNTLLLTAFPQLFPRWTAEYFYGMGIAACWQRSLYRVWISPQFGFALGLGVALLMRFSKSVGRTFKLLLRPSAAMRRGVSYPSLLLLLGMYLAGTGISVAIYHYLVPDLPLYVSLATSVGLSLLLALVVTMSWGELGFGPLLPWPWQAIVYLTPYKGYAGWVFSPAISLGGCGGMVNATKVAYLTETNPIDYYKGVAVGAVLTTVLGFIFMDFFWRIAPIPSSAYPHTMTYWPIYAMGDCLFATRQIHIDPAIVIGSAGASAAILALGQALSKVAIPFSPVAFVMGFFTLPPFTITIFVGSLVGRYILRRFIGKERWERVRGIMAAGALAGTGFGIGIGISIALLAKASWIWPW